MNIRDLERQSIRQFLNTVSMERVFHENDVLDYGCGAQPYREIIVMGGGRYHGYDLSIFPASVTEGEDYQEEGIFDRKWKVIVCTQVVQYVPDVNEFLRILYSLLEKGGALVITWPTNWPEVEQEDLHRFTLSGMCRMLYEQKFREVQGGPRAFVETDGGTFYLGHGAVAWK